MIESILENHSRMGKKNYTVYLLMSGYFIYEYYTIFIKKKLAFLMGISKYSLASNDPLRNK